MGALCSGKSDNPAHLDPARPNIRANGAVSSAPKATYV